MATHSSILGLENSMDKGAWQTTVHVVELSLTSRSCLGMKGSGLLKPALLRSVRGEF